MSKECIKTMDRQTDKQEILIIFPGSMDLGGIERSLIGLLDSIDYRRYETDLFLYSHHGPLFPLINPNVNILPEINELAWLRSSLVSKILHGAWYSVMLRVAQEICFPWKKMSFDHLVYKVNKRFFPEIKKEYDLAICFFRPFDMLGPKIKAKKKAGWIHTDYGCAGVNLMRIEEDYSRVETIVAVSNECGRSFSNLFPNLRNRLITIENILPTSYVRQEAKKPIPSNEMQENARYRLLTVGRFSYPKNMDNIPDLCRRIRKAGIDIIWYLIGYGSEEDEIKQKINEFGMKNYVIILGKKTNPYPYMSRCDVYVQPSRYEGKSVCVREAQMLGKPVVITNYDTSGSQLEDGVDGVIVPMDNEGCANGIISLLRDSKKMKELENNCKKRDYSNAGEIEKIYRMMEC